MLTCKASRSRRQESREESSREYVGKQRKNRRNKTIPLINVSLRVLIKVIQITPISWEIQNRSVEIGPRLYLLSRMIFSIDLNEL